MQREPVIAVVVAPGDAAPPGLEADGTLGNVRVADNTAELGAALSEAEVVFAWDFHTTLLRDSWPSDAAVRWIHAGSIGVDTVMFEAVVAADVVVTNTRGIFERPIAEYALGLMLLFAKDLRGTLELQARHEWRHRETETLAGRRLVIVGAGAIGSEVARLARAVGMDVAAIGRSARSGTADRGAVHAIGELDELLGTADFVVLAVPLTDETRGLFDAERLARMRPGARLINIGRGALVDEQALVDALRSGQLGGAGLDVFEHEPLPADHPLWSLPQVVVSPHMSGDRLGWREDTVALFLENLRRWRAGEPLLHVIDKQRAALRAVRA
jgi:phosphoglycerate dehydrogenase-like enzyme